MIKTGQKIDALTGVRGVAVLLVFGAHLQQRYFTYQALDGTAIAAAAYFGITIFFVLSGFVIHWNYDALFETERPAAAWGKFFAARFARLWPLHFAVCLLGIVISNDYQRLIGSHFLQHLFMVQTWIFQGSENIAYYHTWSISTEWFFYFVYAAGYPIIARQLRSGSTLFFVAIVGSAFAIYWKAGPVHINTDMWLRYIAPYLRVLEFLTGVAAAQIVMTRRDQGRGLPPDMAVVVILALTAALYRTQLGQLTIINYLIAPLVAVVLIVISDRRSIAAGWLSARWLQWAGDRSYSIYLLEAVYLVHSRRVEIAVGYDPSREFTWQSLIVGGGFALFALGLVLFLSDYCWRYFEMPARDLLRRVLNARRRTVEIVPL